MQGSVFHAKQIPGGGNRRPRGDRREGEFGPIVEAREVVSERREREQERRQQDGPGPQRAREEPSCWDRRQQRGVLGESRFHKTWVAGPRCERF